MKSLFQLTARLGAAEKLEKNQILAIKGGDDKRPPRPGGDPVNPPPQPNGMAWGFFGNKPD